MMIKRIGLMLVILGLAIGGVSACGKRGDPYRPSDVPAKSSDS
ncbi:hypothetical protein N9E91_05995 [Alphaproteobacteria bacterium]|nr:hypothetical protein [Alphaproteobacteria bacterium]